MAILNRLKLCIWALRLPSDGVDEMLDFALDVDDFYSRYVVEEAPTGKVLAEQQPQAVIETVGEDSRNATP